MILYQSLLYGNVLSFFASPRRSLSELAEHVSFVPEGQNL